MAYVQANNPFPVTSCGRRRTFTQGGSPGKDRTEESPFMRTKPYTAGMTAAERKTYNNKTGGNVKAPQPGGGARKRSYCARSKGQMKKFPKAAKDPNSRLRKARRRWKC